MDETCGEIRSEAYSAGREELVNEEAMEKRQFGKGNYGSAPWGRFPLWLRLCIWENSVPTLLTILPRLQAQQSVFPVYALTLHGGQ